MNYIVMDLEYNQPFDFASGEKTIIESRCPLEVIQIGLVKLDDKLETVDTASFFVQPQLYTRMHPYVEKITGITNEMLSEERHFADVYDSFIEFIGEGRNVICTWGSDDLKELYKNIMFYRLNYKEMPRRYINVQKHAGTFLNNGMGSIGLRNAVEALGINIEMPFHDALYDAIYTAEVMKKIDIGLLTISNFSVNDLKTNMKAKESRVNLKPLFDYAEKHLRKKLSEKEKNAVLKIYTAGQEHRFDFHSAKSDQEEN